MKKNKGKTMTARGGLVIPYEIADGITLAVLQDHIAIIQEEVRAHVEDGSYMHPEDYHKNMVKLIPALELLIEYFGG